MSSNWRDNLIWQTKKIFSGDKSSGNEILHFRSAGLFIFKIPEENSTLLNSPPISLIFNKIVIFSSINLFLSSILFY